MVAANTAPNQHILGRLIAPLKVRVSITLEAETLESCKSQAPRSIVRVESLSRGAPGI
jgi:hypothetical protein